MKVAEVMTRGVITITPQSGILEAAELMLHHRLSGLPVIDASGTVVGIVTEGDLIRRAETGTATRRKPWLEFLVGPERLAREFIATHGRKVGEIMTRDVSAIAPESTLAELVSLMERRRVKRVPVIAGRRLVGIVSRADLVRALVEVLATPVRPGASDAEIRQQILAMIDREPWGPRLDVSVTVRDGVVDLDGTFSYDHERAALTVLAENTPGVKSVHDHLVWVEPYGGTVVPPAGAPPTIN